MAGTPPNNAQDAESLLRVDKDLYTPHEIADLLDNVTVEMVQNAIWEHRLPAVIDEHHHIVGIHRADFLAWLNRR